eukprot:jgi/Phyca11/130069/e_gw1.90.71.1
MERAIAHFKRSHPTRIHLLQVIVVDKDLNEIRVLEEHFPEARVIICHFHVIKYLKEKRSKPEYGKISGEDASHIDAAIHKMVYAQTETQYKDAHDSLKGICDRTGMNGFYDYFQKNWDSSQDRWVSYLRAKLPHFKNHTNNRLESFFGKLKDSVDGSMSMAMCVKAIVAYDKRKQNEYEYRLSRIGRFVNSNYDEELTNVLRFTTHYVAQQIEPQYARAMSKYSTYKYQEDPDVDGTILVSGIFSEHRLQVTDWKCDCEFSVSMILPCRHAIAYRKHIGVSGPLIPWSCIDERSVSNIENEDEFDEMLNFVLTQWRNVRQRKRGDCEDTGNGGGETNSRQPRANDTSEESITRVEVDGSSNGSEDDSEAGSNDNPATDQGKVCQPHIRLNPKSKKVGAPRKLKKNTVAVEKEGRKWYEAAESGRKIAGEVTLLGLLNALERDKPDSVLSADIRDRVLRQVKEEGVESVFLPLNFGNLHWCCVVVKVHTKRIYYYDPLNHTSYKSAANAVAVRLKVAGLNDYEPIPMNNPLQFDGFSCGVYVCWMFIRQITYGHLDMNDATLPKRRFELFIYLLTGRLLPAEAAAADLTELKPIAPQSDDNNIDDDEAAPTQAADK